MAVGDASSRSPGRDTLPGDDDADPDGPTEHGSPSPSSSGVIPSDTSPGNGGPLGASDDDPDASTDGSDEPSGEHDEDELSDEEAPGGGRIPRRTVPGGIPAAHLLGLGRSTLDGIGASEPSPEVKDTSAADTQAVDPEVVREAMESAAKARAAPVPPAAALPPSPLPAARLPAAPPPAAPAPAAPPPRAAGTTGTTAPAPPPPGALPPSPRIAPAIAAPTPPPPAPLPAPAARARDDARDTDEPELSVGGASLHDSASHDSASHDSAPDDAARDDSASHGTPPPQFDFDADEDSDPFGSLATGTELGGRYRLEKVLGKGATGVVFEASHLAIGKRVALKCLYPHHRATPNAVERFFREARIAATVEHPNVIQVFDGGDEKDTLFLAMELLEGEPLGDRMDRGPMPLAETVRIFLQIMSGVAAVHERGVVHRDLKPDNIFLCSSRFQRRIQPKVLDFGISKLKEPGLRELTTLGTVMGTPFYMAPEQVTNTRDVDVRADVYALGVMMYEALAGDVPYYGETVLEIFRAAQAGGAPPLNELRNDVSSELSEVIARAMAQEREQRFASVAELASAINRLGLDVTDPEHENPPVPDVRSTVRDMPSPLNEAPVPPRAGESLPGPASTGQASTGQASTGQASGGQASGVPNTSPSVDPLRLRGDEKRTVALARPQIIERTPVWVYYALASAAGLTLAAMLIAVLALLL